LLAAAGISANVLQNFRQNRGPASETSINPGTMNRILHSVYGDTRMPDFQASGVVPQGFHDQSQNVRETVAGARTGENYFSPIANPNDPDHK
jgi:hypothetical protein